MIEEALKFYTHISPSQRSAIAATDVNAKLYYASKNDQYSSLVMMVTIPGSNGSTLKIANLFGSFNNNILGSSFNLPPPSMSNHNPGVMQMTAYANDPEGIAFLSQPGGPPACSKFNYSIMTMDVTGTSFPIKTSTWKTGDAIPYVLNTDDMKELDISDLSNSSVWCKDIVATPKSTKKGLSSTSTILLVVGILVSLAVVYYFYTKNTHPGFE